MYTFVLELWNLMVTGMIASFTFRKPCSVRNLILRMTTYGKSSQVQYRAFSFLFQIERH